MEERITQLEKALSDLQREYSFHKHTGTDSYVIELETLGLPSQLTNAPEATITSPTGGITIDSEARTAINTIITRLETLGLVEPN